MIVETSEDLAEALTVIRSVEGWSQRRLAEMIGTTPSRIADYERGRRVMNPRTWLRLLGAMGYRIRIERRSGDAGQG